MAPVSEPIRADRLTVVPANKASWDDLRSIPRYGGLSGALTVSEVQGRRLFLARLHPGAADRDAPGPDRLR
jgi:hypothetical protein